MTYETVRLKTDPVAASIHPFHDQGRLDFQDQRCWLGDDPFATALCVIARKASPRWATVVARSLICAAILVGLGCRQQTGPRQYTEEESKAQVDQLLAAYPSTPTDTPEQIREKEAKVDKALPRVYELLEDAKTDSAKIDEAVELSMNQLTLLPGHRAAKVAYGKAQLASFLAKEATDPYNRAIAINSAVLEMDRLRENYDDLSDDERQLCQEVYFHRARQEGYYPKGENAPEIFKEMIEKLVSLGFDDVERLKAEPNFKYFFTDPKFAPVLESAIAQIEASADNNSSQ